jgi:hypothetical protein
MNAIITVASSASTMVKPAFHDEQDDGLRYPRCCPPRVDEIGDERQDIDSPAMASDFTRRIADTELFAIGQASENGARCRRQCKTLI